MLRTLLRSCIDILVPPHDVVRAARAVRADTLATLLAPRTVGRLGWVHALWPYADPNIRALVKAAKYYGDSESAILLGERAADYVLELVHELRTLDGCDEPLIVPIASAPARQKARGYNQAARIARALATASSLPYAELLTRTDRQSQVHVQRNKRKKNIENAFHANAAAAGRSILLIDDVVESGATVGDARRALRDAGATNIIAIAMAH